jgi:hypothetical protein
MKMALGELEIQRHSLMGSLDAMKARFSQNEDALIKKYGERSVINIKTGEVTYPNGEMEVLN